MREIRATAQARAADAVERAIADALDDANDWSAPPAPADLSEFVSALIAGDIALAKLLAPRVFEDTALHAVELTLAGGRVH